MPAARRSAAKKPTGGDGVYIATESGVAEVAGVEYVFHKDVTRVREGHPLLKAAPNFFKSAGEDMHYDVESATAAPGEKRGG